MTVLILPPRLNPYEEWFLGWGTVVGATILLGVTPAPAAIAALPDLVGWLWALVLACSGVVGWVGCRLHRRDPPLGLRLEEAGVLFAAGALVFYLTATLAHGLSSRLLVGAGVMGMLVVAHAVRVAQIERQLREMRPE